MKRIWTFLLIALPTILGKLFLLWVQLEHHLFRQSIITARGALSLELLFLLLFLTSCLTAVGVGLQFIKQKQYLAIAGATTSIILGVALCVIGLADGAAILYAT